MSLHFVIDGYNITNHRLFRQYINKKIKDQRLALLELIRAKRLTGSPKNIISVVFDGHAQHRDFQDLTDNYRAVNIIFSREETADERIRKIIQASLSPVNMVVVSDDKEIIFFAKGLKAKYLSVEEFIAHDQEKKSKGAEDSKKELNFSQVQNINQELKSIWLRE